MIRLPSEIDASTTEFGPVKILDNGGKTVNVSHDGQSLKLETGSLKLPYGLNVFDKTLGAPVKYSVDLSLDDSAAELKNFLEAFDERMIDAGVENAQKWFKMPNASREVVKAFYTPLVKYSRDAQGNPKPYPPTFKVNLRPRRFKNGAPADLPAAANAAARFEAEFYNAAERDAKGNPTLFPRDATLDQLLSKRTFVTAIIQCSAVWFAGGKFGTTWSAVQFRVDSQPDQIRGPAFRSDVPEVRVAATTAPVAEEDEVEEEEEAEAPKKVFVEEVAEPVPVPKKVFKKPAPKAAK
jgi:hypothetical protein